ncbi:MAG: YcxB family protein [Hyphomonadaceae bacterium]|nr:YcxB family protein [Hyphomonadaceae bacterium]
MGALGAAASYFLARPWQDPLIEAAITGAIVVGLMFVLNVIAIFFAAASGTKLPGALGPIFYTISDEALEVKSSVGSGTNQWINWRGAFENDRVMVIRHRANLMHILPKRQLSPEQQDRIRALLRRVLAGRVALKDRRA